METRRAGSPPAPFVRGSPAPPSRPVLTTDAGGVGGDDEGDGAIHRSPLSAHVVPLVVFAVLLGVQDLVRRAGTASGATSLWLTRPEYWVHPLQAVLCTAAVLWFWRDYRFAPFGARALAWAAAAGVLAWGVWVSPQVWFGASPRTTSGFDPTPLAGQPVLYWTVLLARLARLAVVVPFVEEVFWRGFLLRYLAEDEGNFARASYRFRPLSFGVVVAGFTLEHQPADWAAAAVVGILYNALAVRTQSLGACVLAHAVTNAALGAYILATRQWGFW